MNGVSSSGQPDDDGGLAFGGGVFLASMAAGRRSRLSGISSPATMPSTQEWRSIGTRRAMFGSIRFPIPPSTIPVTRYVQVGQTHVPRYTKPLIEKSESGAINPSFVSRIAYHRRRSAAHRTFRDKEDGCIKMVPKA
jgi:hypothetical protein